MPTHRLTARNVRTLQAQTRRTNYRDDPTAPGSVRGLVLRVSPTGARTWALEYSRRNRTRRYTIGPLERVSLAEAREIARDLYAGILRGDDPQAVKAARRRATLTVDDLVGQMLDALRLRPSTRRVWTHARATSISTIGAHIAADLTRPEIRSWGQALASRSPYTADTAWRVLRRAYSWGVEQDLLVGTPFAHLPKPGADQLRERDRVLSDNELRLLLLALDDLPGLYASATSLLLLTGTRREEVIGMRWSEVRGDTWVIPAARTKSSRAHVVPLSEPAVAILADLYEITGPAAVVFPPARGQGPTMSWSSRYVRNLVRRMEERAYAEAHELEAPAPPPDASTGRAWIEYPRLKLPQWQIHDLRRTVATGLREALGVDRDLVRLILGHAAQAGALTRYDRAERVEERRQALSLWASRIVALRATQGPPGAGLGRGGGRVSRPGATRGRRGTSGRKPRRARRLGPKDGRP